jgi:hypothetical protein
MLPHPDKERSARRAGLTGGTGLRKNFFDCDGWDILISFETARACAAPIL